MLHRTIASQLVSRTLVIRDAGVIFGWKLIEPIPIFYHSAALMTLHR